MTSAQLPRLTGTIRAFSRISQRYDELSQISEANILKKRRELEQSLKSSDLTIPAEINWPNLVDKLVADKTNQKWAKLKALLDKLKTNMSKQFLNEDFNDSRLLNEAAIFIFESFYDHRNTSSASASNFEGLDKLAKKLKERFGQFQRNLFDHCRELMEEIFTEINLLNLMAVIDDFFNKSKMSLTDNLNVKVLKFIHFYLVQIGLL